MTPRNVVFSTLLILVLLLPLHASPIVFNLTYDGCTGGCGPGPFGTVTLTQINSNSVGVSVDLISPSAFVDTGGPHHALAWNIAKTPSLTITELSTGFTQVFGDPGLAASPFGAFQYAIDCTGCGKGASSPLPGPLSFTVTTAGALSTADFIATEGKYYFAVDIIGPSGRTGNVAAMGTLDPGSPSPEPSTMFLSGTALAAVACWIRRRRAR